MKEDKEDIESFLGEMPRKENLRIVFNGRFDFSCANINRDSAANQFPYTDYLPEVEDSPQSGECKIEKSLRGSTHPAHLMPTKDAGDAIRSLAKKYKILRP